MVIDFHTHIVPPQIKSNPGKYTGADPCFALLYSSPNPRLATADELIESMDKDGVDVSVVLNIAWDSHELCVQTNDYILESVARYPKRLVGFCTVQPRSLVAAMDEIERCAKAGARGVGEVRPDSQLFELGAEELASLVSAIVGHKMILLIHASEPVGHVYPGKGSVTPERLYPFITHFPDLTLVCAHWGGGLPFYALMPEVKKAMGNVFFDTAASPFLYTPQVYNQVVQLVGAAKVLFGSDYPLLAQRRLLKDIETLDLPEETKRLILSGNARRLLDVEGRRGET